MMLFIPRKGGKVKKNLTVLCQLMMLRDLCFLEKNCESR